MFSMGLEDLKEIQEVGRPMVVKLGMSGEIGYVQWKENENGAKLYGEKTNRAIDNQYQLLIRECRERVE